MMNRTAAASGISVHTEIVGEHETVAAQVGRGEEAVVLLHAIGLDWRMWTGVMLSLPSDVHAIAVDLAGFGAAAGADVATLEAQAEDLVEFLDRLGLRRVHLAGASYGGALAQLVALAYPQRLASLTLVATIARAEPDVFEERAAVAEAEPGADVDQTLSRWFTNAELVVNDHAVRYARERLLANKPASWAAGWRAFAGFDTLERLASIALPTTVIAGELDGSARPAHMATMAKRLPRSSYHVIPGAAHMLALERPADVARLIAAGCAVERTDA
jgi:3-oxoadipate enol-lactonase